MTDPSKIPDIRIYRVTADDKPFGFLQAIAYWRAFGLGFEDIAVKLGVPKSEVRPHVIRKK